MSMVFLVNTYKILKFLEMEFIVYENRQMKSMRFISFSYFIVLFGTIYGTI